MQRGKLAVVGMLLLGFGAAIFAWQWNRSRGRYAAEFWGAESARLIRNAPTVTAFKVTPHLVFSEVNTLSVPDSKERWLILETKDVSKAPGLLHARNALLEDAGFDREYAAAAEPQYRWAVRFADQEKQVTLFLDPDARQIRSDRGSVGGLVPKVSEGWRKAFERYFAKPPAQPPTEGGSPN